MEKYIFPFEKLEVWQEARRLVRDVYGITRNFPPEEKFGLTSQINRAAISVASNLAEGSSRTSLKDQAHFSQLAYSSLMELACQITMASDLGFLRDDILDKTSSDLSALANKINALRKSQLNRAMK